MEINRRRAPSAEVSREKKLGGHATEKRFAELIGGKVLPGTQKTDVRDPSGRRYSVKSGKKWQVFLYGRATISNSKYLKILTPCIDSFITDANKYFEDRTKCIAFKERHLKSGSNVKPLSNEELASSLGPNEYINSKARLGKATLAVSNRLADKAFLKEFLGEALFNGEEVGFLVIKDERAKNDVFRIFAKEEALIILSRRLTPGTSTAGRVPQDYNVAGQKTLLKYDLPSGKKKNIIEIEVRNDRSEKYRHVRFNMYSKDALVLLMEGAKPHSSKSSFPGVILHGQAKQLCTL